MRTNKLPILTAALLVVLASLPAHATDGQLTVEVHGAEAVTPGTDDGLNPPQDFYVRYAIDYGPPAIAPEKSGRDRAEWSPPHTLSKLVPMMNQRFFDLYFELWDKDTCCDGNVDDDFDISPQQGVPPPPPPVYNPSYPNGGFPHIRYDVCTGEMLVIGTGGAPWIPIGSNDAELSGEGTTSGTINNWAKLQFEVKRSPGTWLPDDLAITLVAPVQSVYEPHDIVADKETSLLVEAASSYPFDLLVPLRGEMTDGITTVQDFRFVTLRPGLNRFVLFDGTGQPPFLPFKPAWVNSATLSAWARIELHETVSPNAPPQLMDCANINNEVRATALPIHHTLDKKTVYQRFDYQDTADFMPLVSLGAMYSREELLRQTSWPLASVTSLPAAAALSWDSTLGLDPYLTLLKGNMLAAVSGIDRLVLSVRNGWFADNASRHPFGPSGAVGLSLGPAAPRAVLAEDGFYGVAVHELGHTYGESQHKCSNGGLIEDWFGLGCFDEYNHPAVDGRVYAAVGFDARGSVYSSGSHASPSTWPGLVCPAVSAAGREVCGPNFMDLTPSTGYETWVDSLTFHDLFAKLRPGFDPPLLNVSGTIHLPAGPGNGSSAPAISGRFDVFSYQFLGTQDLSESPLSPSGEAFSGTGAFRIRFLTPGGFREYRFNPRFFQSPTSSEHVAFFSLNLPWDPSALVVLLFGPADLRVAGCQNVFCPGSEMLLADRPVSPAPPVVSDLRAGRDVPAPAGGPPTVAVIGPGHQAVLSWSTSDPDSPETRALILAGLYDPPTGLTNPVPIDVDVAGGTYSIPYDRLSDGPGTYAVRLLSSDGVRTSEVTSGPLFTICTLNQGGLETCNGIDDDCDGIVDNAATPGGPIQVTLNPHPLPPALVWNPVAGASSYDVVYGSLGALRTAGGGFGTATVGCLADNTSTSSLATVPTPPLGDGYWLVVRATNCGGAGSWNDGSASQIGTRDSGINGSANACAP